MRGAGGKLKPLDSDGDLKAAGATHESRSRESWLLWWCVVASLAAHALMLKLLPGWYIVTNPLPVPLTVELRAPPAPLIVPAKSPEPLPMHTRPVSPERPQPTPPKPEVRPSAEKPLAHPRAAPMLTAPIVLVVPEQGPAPPSVQSTEVPRSTPAPAPVTPPRSDASYLNNPRPVYPMAARRRGDQGTVLVRVLVTAEGAAATVGLEKTSGHSALDEAALTAVKSWRFVPARQGGQGVEAPYIVPIIFRID